MRIVFIGPPGAGKGTQAAKLIEKYNLAHLSTGDMLRAARDAKTKVGVEADRYMSAGMLVPDNVIMDIIAERLEQSDVQNGYLLDGFPRTIAQAEALDAILAKKRTPLDVVLELKVPEEELFRRLAGRGRADDNPEVIRQRLVAYRKQTEPLLDYYSKRELLKSIDGLGTVEEIFDRAASVLDRVAKNDRREELLGVGMLRSPRQLRSAREIAAMRQAGLVVWHALKAIEPFVRPGTTTAEIDAIVADFFKKHNAEPLFLNFPNSTPGWPPFPAVTCISINEEVVHGIPTAKRKFKEGDIVSVDTGCKLAGWCGDAAVTYPVGKIDADKQDLLNVTQNALFMAIDLMGKRSRWSEVASQMEKYVKDHRYTMVEDFVGHGIGRQMHEDPQVPNFVSRRAPRSADFRLEPGLVIAVEPMVNMGTKEVKIMADRWTQVTRDNKPSAHFEHTIAVTTDGPKILTAGPNGELK